MTSATVLSKGSKENILVRSHTFTSRTSRIQEITYRRRNSDEIELKQNTLSSSRNEKIENHQRQDFKRLLLCGYNIKDNLDFIKEQWQPQFPSSEFPLYYATIYYINFKLKNNPKLDSTIKDQLILAGFNSITAIRLATFWKNNEVFDWEPLTYWINVYIETLCPIPCQKERHQKFLNNKRKKGEWYDEPMIVGPSKTKTEAIIKVIYVSEVTEIPPLKIGDEETDDINLKLKNGNIYYHGTSAKSLPSIINEGILMDKSIGRFDFSYNNGFYMSQDIDLAKRWAEGRNGKQKQKDKEAQEPFEGYNAVLIYQFDRSEFQVVDLTENLDDWKDTVDYYRNEVQLFGRKDELMVRLEEAQYIYGAMSGGGSKKGRLKPKRDMQLCIKKMAMAMKVTYSLKGIVYVVQENKK